MSPDAIQKSICPDCYRCERERKTVNGESLVDCQCEYPQYRHQFGRVRASVDCPGFFRRAVFMRYSCQLPLGC